MTDTSWQACGQGGMMWKPLRERHENDGPVVVELGPLWYAIYDSCSAAHHHGDNDIPSAIALGWITPSPPDHNNETSLMVGRWKDPLRHDIVRCRNGEWELAQRSTSGAWLETQQPESVCVIDHPPAERGSEPPGSERPYIISSHHSVRGGAASQLLCTKCGGPIRTSAPVTTPIEAAVLCPYCIGYAPDAPDVDEHQLYRCTATCQYWVSGCSLLLDRGISVGSVCEIKYRMLAVIPF